MIFGPELNVEIGLGSKYVKWVGGWVGGDSGSIVGPTASKKLVYK